MRCNSSSRCCVFTWYSGKLSANVSGDIEPRTFMMSGTL
ncbi:hypothetical protein UJ11_003573 [Salmonella enterica subsp. enterica]|nr:hypothetical protein [Salmonella enterica subsp. enterica serovar Baguida]